MKCFSVLSLVLLVFAMRSTSAGSDSEDLQILAVTNQACIDRGPQERDYRIQQRGVCAETACIMGIRYNPKIKRKQMYLKDTEMSVCNDLDITRSGCTARNGNPRELFPDCCPTLECNGVVVNEPYHRADDLELVFI